MTWAWSLGGPGRNFGEHNGESSIFGIIYPHSLNSVLGVANSYKINIFNCEFQNAKFSICITNAFNNCREKN